ncbi:hypothetical protein quinque_003745 [Culex quinquefasciatus]
MDSWHRSRPDDEPSTTDWRSGSGTGGGGNGLSTSLSGSSLRDKWSRSTSWREEEIGDGPGGRPLHSSSAGGGYKPRMSALSGGDLNTSGGPGGGLRRHWDADDQLPEWATENPSDYGGSFDASGPFHDSDNDIDGRLEDDGGKENHADHRYHHQRKGGSSGGSSRRSVPSSKEGSAAKEDLPNHAASSEKASEEADPGSKKKSEPVRNATADEKPPKASESESRRPRWRIFSPWIMGSCSLALKVNLRTQQQIRHRLCFGIDRK